MSEILKCLHPNLRNAILMLLAHIDAQAAQIENLERIKGNYCTEIQQLRKRADDLAEVHNEFFDNLNKQIEALKKMLIAEKAKVLYFAHVGDGMYDMSLLEEMETLKDRHIPEARQQLKAEMPEGDWE